MLHYFKFRNELFAPQPAKDVYIKRGKGRGWPEECPPVRAANGFGFDLLANFDVTFIRDRKGWRVARDIVIDSDFDYVASDDAQADQSPGKPLSQQYAWFWEKGQRLPHVISDNVYAAIANQVKISSYLFLATDQNEMLLMTDVPNLSRPWRAMSAVIETDWYPASYPWHCVIELNPDEKRITIRKGDPLCRVIPLRRDTYFARQMSPETFDAFFARGQDWLAKHGRVEHEAAGQQEKGAPTSPAPKAAGLDGTLDITRTYSRQQLRSKFIVLE